MKKETYKILLHTFNNPHLCKSRVAWWVKKQFEILTIDNMSSHALWFSFIFSFKTLAKVTLTFNHHGLTLSNNTGCLKIENLPVLAKDLEAMRNVKSNSKPSTAAAKGMKKETCEIRFLNSLHLCGSWVVWWWMTKKLDTKKLSMYPPA